jgi:hypothetical protein
VARYASSSLCVLSTPASASFDGCRLAVSGFSKLRFHRAGASFEASKILTLPSFGAAPAGLDHSKRLHYTTEGFLMDKKNHRRRRIGGRFGFIGLLFFSCFCLRLYQTDDSGATMCRLLT